MRKPEKQPLNSLIRLKCEKPGRSLMECQFNSAKEANNYLGSLGYESLGRDGNEFKKNLISGRTRVALVFPFPLRTQTVFAIQIRYAGKNERV